MIKEQIIDLVQKLEGPWRWYVIGVVLLIITGLVLRFIFKTFKWFILLAIMAFVIIGGLWVFISAASG